MSRTKESSLDSNSGQVLRPSYTFTRFPRGLFSRGTNDQMTALAVPPRPQRRASKASLEAMPKVTVSHEDGNECRICLNGFKVGEEVKELPCKHSFHAKCIDKWLASNIRCPICRFAMPTELDDEQIDTDELR